MQQFSVPLLGPPPLSRRSDLQVFSSQPPSPLGQATPSPDDTPCCITSAPAGRGEVHDFLCSFHPDTTDNSVLIRLAWHGVRLMKPRLTK